MDERPKIIHHGDKPEILEEVINPKTLAILKSLTSKIEIGEQFFEHGELQTTANTSIDDWFTLADAQVRVSPRGGCDRISITKVHTIVASFPLLYKDQFLLYIKTIYLASTKEVEITNLDMVIATINSKICPRCIDLYDECKHSKPKTKATYDAEIEIPTLVHDGRPLPNRFLMEDMTEEEMLAPTKEEQVDYTKYDPVINSLISTYKMKGGKDIKRQAYEIIRQKPNIREEDLVKQIFQNQAKP